MSKNTTFSSFASQAEELEHLPSLKLVKEIVTVKELMEFLTMAVEKCPDVVDFKVVHIEFGKSTDTSKVKVNHTDETVSFD